MTGVPKWCVHKNIAYSCTICQGKPPKKIEFIDESLFTENVRCKLCDSETRARPKLKTYKCNVCLFRSNKNGWPNYNLQKKGDEEFRRFRRGHWKKIPKWRQEEIVSGKNLSEEYMEFYSAWLDCLRTRPGFKRSPSKNRDGHYYMRE